MKQSYEFLKEWLDDIKLLYGKPESDNNPYRASSAGTCARKLAYGKLYPELLKEEDLSVELISLFQLGHQLHDSERELLQTLGYKLTMVEGSVEYKLLMSDMTELVIKGRVDGVLELENEKILIDIKTARAGKFNQARSMGIPYAYKCQAQVYLNALGYSRMWFLYYNKDTSERMVLEYISDPDILQQVETRFSSVYDCVSEETLPDKEHKPYRKKEKGKLTDISILDYNCAGCHSRDKCWPDYTLNTAGTHYTLLLE